MSEVIVHTPPARRGLLPRRARSFLLACVLVVGAVAPAVSGVSKSRAAGNDTLVIGWPLSPLNFDAPNEPDNPSIWVAVNIYDALLRPGNDGISLQPDLATSWDISKDLKVYTFHLRTGVKFTDGTPVTAADVKFCLDRVRSPKPLAAWQFLETAIASVDAVNPSTVKITLKYPWAPFLSDVAIFSSGVYPEAYFKRVGTSGLAAHPIGSGPYYLSSFKPGVTTILKKNLNYWDAKSYPLNQIEFRVITDDTSRLVQVQSGGLDVDNVLAPNLVAQLKASQSAQPELNPSTAVTYLQPNHQVKPWQDVKVRQAVNYAIDRAALNHTVYYGYATPANSFMPKGMIDWDPNIKAPVQNLVLAKKLMSESSVPKGFSMNYQVRAGDVADNQLAVVFQQEVAPLGIKVTIQPENGTTLNTNSFNYNFDFFNEYWTNDIPDPDELVFYSLDPTDVNDYYTHYNDPTLANLSRQAERTSDQGKRARLYYKIQEIFADQVPWFPVEYVPLIDGVNNHVHGFKQNPLGYFVFKGVTKS
jgi:peptide/nickel transport system substrate-binding protein